MSPQATSAKSIFLEAIESCAPHEWGEFLNEACGNDQALRARVESLLEAHGESNPLLDGKGGLCRFSESSVAEPPGTIIGRYRLVEEIGEGGFGIVYMAEQVEPVRRRVALKIIKPGMDTRQVVARFDTERQALALMDHPNIAKVLDAGSTDSGRPYFVMELVSGVPITEYCDQCSLTTRQRLELFVTACQAVHHAHRKGIIHRDVKPGNVLIAMQDGKPTPKVIDFGVAKATDHRLTEHSYVTGFAQVLGTPLYMSPEQAELSALDVDTRTDIYSLGVLLYELLTGTTPFDKERLSKASLSDLQRILREEEPPKPSTRISTLDAWQVSTTSNKRRTQPHMLSQQMRGDLDWIVMRAMEKDQTRRYDTANELAQDVQRYLNHEPVLASPPSTTYRVAKFVRRNRAMLAAATLISVVMIAGTVASTWQAVRATRALQSSEISRRNEGLQRHKTAIERDRAVQAEQRLDSTVYAQRIGLAYSEWRGGNVQRARQLLSQCDVELRHWEWDYLQRLCNSELLTISHWPMPSWFSCVAFHPDGRRIAAGVDGGAHVRIFDANSGRRLRSLTPHRLSRMSDICFSRDGSRIASITGFYDATRDRAQAGELKVWDGDEPAEPLFEFEDCINTASFTSDGQQIAWATNRQTIVIWDLAMNQQVHELSADSMVHAVSFSPDDKNIAAGCHDNLIRVWDAHTGEVVHKLNGHTRAVLCIAYSPDGRHLASGSQDRTASIWDMSDGTRRTTFARHEHPVQAIAYDPDGTRVATAGGVDHSLWVWDPVDGREILALRGHSGYVGDVAFSPDGKRLASRDGDGSVKVWDALHNPQSRTISRHGWFINAVTVSPDGQLVASAANDSTAIVADMATGKRLATFHGHGNNVRNVVFTPDSRQVISSGRDGTVQVWDARTAQRVRRFDRHQPAASVKALALAPDGVRLASGDDDGVIIVWQWATGRELLRFGAQGYQIWCVNFSPDGKRIVSAGADRTAKIWNAETGQLQLTLRGHQAVVRSAQFSPDGERIYTAGESDGTIRVWNARTGQQLRALEHGTTVYGLALSPDGRRLVGACSQGVIQLWDTDTFESLLRLPGSGQGYHYATFSPNGHHLLAGGNGNVVEVWDGSPLSAERIAQPFALNLVTHLYTSLQLKAAVIEEITSDTSLDERVRAVALNISEKIEESPSALNKWSWDVVQRPNGDATAYRHAVRQAAEACRLEPSNSAFLNTLGAGYYRIAEYRKAIDKCQEAIAADPSGGSPIDWFFIAMSWHQLGDAQKAEESFQQALRLWTPTSSRPATPANELARVSAEAAQLLGIDLSGAVPLNAEP